MYVQFVVHPWHLLVPTIKLGSTLRPIYHLQKDNLWRVIAKTGEQQQDFISSKKVLFDQTSHGELDDDLFTLVKSPIYRPIIRTILLDAYFPDTKQHYLQEHTIPAYISDIEASILQERIAKKKLITRTKEGFVRDWKFRHLVMHLYEYTCCMSRLKVEPNYAIIEACHIQSHHEFGDDAITNGIPLCANLHIAFDNGILSLDKHYQILLKGKKYFEENDSPYNLRQLEGKQILLPTKEQFYPSLERLHWHRKRFGF